ncbi:MAG: diphosphomevalonate decarboxylase [Flavobacteriaceae bacterium]|nr:MAG: diphosphomevalonate decarboxylase [Flavobacteriaceae bacterium]
MIEQDFIPRSIDTSKLTKGSFTWKTPSNIALVKYWGKREPQIPENTSISFTLDACHTITTLSFSKNVILSAPDSYRDEKSHPVFDIYFEGKKKDDFKPKIATFFKRIEKYCPYLKDFDFKIESENSFPHSSGIASSASGMSALALCVMSLEKELNSEISDEYFYKKASFLARLGSGSACRSVKGEVVVWGEHQEIKDSSNLYGVEFTDEVHSNFKNYQDTILLVDKGEKQVSSTLGHDLMIGHPFAENRFQQAEENISKMKSILKSGDLKAFVNLVESEALTLHAMMMTSNPYFILMKPNTLKIIHKIWEYREIINSNVCFTLDAGANVHLLFPTSEKETIAKFVDIELKQFCQNNQYIEDGVGRGAVLMKNEK